MDREAHVENSSSQNVRSNVYGRIRRGAAGKGYIAVPEEGSSFFVPSAVADRFSLSHGQEMTREEFSVLKAAVERVTIKMKAVELLAMREHSVGELRQKLQRRSYDPDVIEEVLEELQRLDYVNDDRFAEVWIRSRIRRHPEGPALLMAGLVKKGVSRSTAEDAIRQADINIEELLERAVEKYSRGAVDSERLIRKLVRKGFSYGDVKRAVHRRSGDDL